MTKLRTLLATALLTLPVLALSAAQPDSVALGKRFEPVSLTGCCLVYLNHHWVCLPC